MWHAGFSSCGSWALEHRLGSCGAQTQLLCGMWDLPRPGIEPVSPALAGGFLTTVPPGKPCSSIINGILFIIFTAPRRGYTDKLYVFPGRVTPGQLTSYIHLFKNNLKVLGNHCGLLQLGLATVQTLKHPQTAKWDNFLAFERLLLQVCCSGSFLGY